MMNAQIGILILTSLLIASPVKAQSLTPDTQSSLKFQPQTSAVKEELDFEEDLKIDPKLTLPPELLDGQTEAGICCACGDPKSEVSNRLRLAKIPLKMAADSAP